MQVYLFNLLEAIMAFCLLKLVCLFSDTVGVYACLFIGCVEFGG